MGQKRSFVVKKNDMDWYRNWILIRGSNETDTFQQIVRQVAATKVTFGVEMRLAR